MISLLKRAIPVKFKQRLRNGYSDYRFVRRMRQLPAGHIPEDKTLAALSSAWNNDGYSADLEYLARVCRAAATTEGPILECGSGLTTLLLSAIAGARGIPIYSLEHSAEWRERVQGMLRRCRLPAVKVPLTRLQSFGDFDWYQMPRSLPHGFRLIICDGPPGSTRGGRYGLMPVCRNLLADDCLVLLDDAERPEEQAILERWHDEFGTESTLIGSEPGAFAEMRVVHENAFEIVAGCKSLQLG